MVSKSTTISHIARIKILGYGVNAGTLVKPCGAMPYRRRCVCQEPTSSGHNLLLDFFSPCTMLVGQCSRPHSSKLSGFKYGLLVLCVQCYSQTH